MNEFIAHDWCGWNEQFGRFTHIPSGETLVCRPGMTQSQWDKAQLEWMRRFPGLTVHSCPDRYSTDGPSMGTTEEIIARLETRLKI
jgi:hypothetical protein